MSEEVKSTSDLSGADPIMYVDYEIQVTGILEP